MISTEAILIRMSRLTETSLIVSWFSEGEGLVKTVAKGALRPRSVFAGKLDLFFTGQIEVVRARKGDLHVLREVVVSDWREGLRRGYMSTLMAGYFCRLVEMGFELQHGDGGAYDLLRRGLDFLEKEDASMRALLHFEGSMAEILGISTGRGDAARVLGEHLGGMPGVRKEIMDRLGVG